MTNFYIFSDHNKLSYRSIEFCSFEIIEPYVWGHTYFELGIVYKLNFFEDFQPDLFLKTTQYVLLAPSNTKLVLLKTFLSTYHTYEKFLRISMTLQNYSIPSVIVYQSDVSSRD